MSAFGKYAKYEGELRGNLHGLAVDEGSLQRRVKACDLGQCRAMCCHDGVFVSAEERATIRGMFGEEALETRDGKWKTRTREAEEGELGENYPAHFPRTRCVLLDENHHCELQKRAIAEGKHPWFYKPAPCWLHPLTITPLPNGRPLLTLPSPQDDPQTREGYPGFAPFTTCGKETADGTPAHQTLAKEVEFLMGILGRSKSWMSIHRETSPSIEPDTSG